MMKSLRRFFEDNVQSPLRDLRAVADDLTTFVRIKMTKIDEELAAHAERTSDALGRANDALARLEQKLDNVSRLSGRLEREIRFVKTRETAYLGNRVAMTWLADETIVYVNSDDEGCPTNFISGGIYEEDNADVLFSFLRPNSVMLDIGANLGVFSLRIAQRLRNTHGRVLAFEPHPRVFGLFKRSVEHNGFTTSIECHNVALSDKNGEAKLYYPKQHLGGGGGDSGSQENEIIDARLQVLDDLLPTETVDVAKIDVEGNELTVLQGMRQLISRSPEIAILFEKLAINSNIDEGLFRFFAEFGLSVYFVAPSCTLKVVDLVGLKSSAGYFLAAKPARVDGELDRRFFDIGWQQLQFQDGVERDLATEVCTVECPNGVMLFHGPYWHLPKGRYQLTINGSKSGGMRWSITESFGVNVVEITMPDGCNSATFETPYDLFKFECVARAAHSDKTRLDFRNVRLRRLG